MTMHSARLFQATRKSPFANLLCAGMIACALGASPLLGQGGFDAPGRYQIANVKTGKAVDIDRSGQSNVLQFSAHGTETQTWRIRPAAPGYFFLRNEWNGFALDAGGGMKSEPVHAVPFNGGDSQQWRFERAKDGNALIVSRLGRALDIPGGSDREGVRIQISDASGGSNQRFAFTRVTKDWGRRDWDRDWEEGQSEGGATAISCASHNGERVFCQIRTTGRGVELVRQTSEAPCHKGETWGWDDRGIWVDHGCRADFNVTVPRQDPGTIVCASEHYARVFCPVDTQGRVRMVHQLGDVPCRQNETWGSNDHGIWVDHGCRAEFVVERF
ncbi:MAG: DUF3011 domain-containing protein [Bryobacteraceae bacterium]